MTPDNNIGDGKAPARFEHPKRFLEHAVFIAGKVNDAVPDDDIHRVLRKGDVLDFAFKELDIGKAAFALIFFCERQISSVMSRPNAFPVGPTRRAESSTSMPPLNRDRERFRRVSTPRVQ
jgi:hypothetical protein